MKRYLVVTDMNRRSAWVWLCNVLQCTTVHHYWLYYCTVLCSTVLYCNVVPYYCTVLYYNIWTQQRYNSSCTSNLPLCDRHEPSCCLGDCVLYWCTEPYYCIVLCCTALTILHCAVLLYYCTVLYCTVYCTVLSRPAVRYCCTTVLQYRAPGSVLLYCSCTAALLC